MLRCGRIAYTNVLPLYAAIDAGVVEYPGSLHAAPPTSLNAMLVDGELDMGPMSAFEWAKHAGDFVLLPGACIGARAAVVSVVLVSAIPPSLLDGKTVYVTDESATGRHLLRTLLERRYGVAPTYAVESRPLDRARAGEPALLIGDKAIDAVDALPPAHVYDLGKLWNEWTGEGMVFAVWAARRDAFERDPSGVAGCMRALRNSHAWSQAHPERVVALAQRTIPRKPGFYESYYGKLHFTFDAPAQRGLAAFCRELRAIGAIDAIPSCQPEQLDAVAR